MSFLRTHAGATLLALAASLTPAVAQQAVAPAVPTIVGAFSKPGVTPDAAICGGFGAGSRAAIGPSSLLQVVNCKTALIDRTTGAILASTSLSSFTGVVGANTDPQMIWDPSTQRFYYAAATAAVVNGLRAYSISFGFSKTAAPANLSTDWCRYSYDLGRDRPNFTRLGDSAYFMIVGYSLVIASPSAVTGAILAISKPPAGTTCPLRSSFKTAVRTNLLDQAGASLQRPTPANQIDNYPTGYVAAINASNAIAFYPVTRRLLDGAPVINNPRYLALTAFASPPLASQPGSAPKLFSERAPAQAVQAMDPRLGKFAL